MSESTSFNYQEYDALRNGSALLVRARAHPLSVSGSDRADFLHRITTNDINSLQAGQSAVTVLTTPTAHIQFVFTVVCREDDLLLLPASGQSELLSAYLRSQIFFMDQVEIESMPYARWRIVGPTSAKTLVAAGWIDADAADGRWWEQDSVLVVQQDVYDIPGYELVSLSHDGDRFQTELVKLGSQILADDVAYNTRRIELGRPSPGYELTDQYNPLEVGMAWACSDSKGCYTGQEIIARQITYDKVTKTLVGLVSDGEMIEGADITVEDKSTGQVTSAAYSPSLEKHLALAIVRRPHNTSGAIVSVQNLQAQVVGLPFQ